MIEVLIVEDDFKYVKNIVNNILYRFDEINIKFITNTVEKNMNVISNNYIDLIFLDLNLSDGKGIEIINKLRGDNCIKAPDIIVLSGETEFINELLKEKSIYAVINKLQDKDYIYNLIKQYLWDFKCARDSNKIKENIILCLKEIGYNFKYKGTVYMFECIEYIYKCNNIDLLDNLEKNVYKYIAYKNKKSINNVKTNLIKTTNLIFTDKKDKGRYTQKL